MQVHNKSIATLPLMLMVVMVLFTLGACTTYQYEGAAVGGALGGLAGALLDNQNPWRGGVIGAALGGMFGATIADISHKGSREAIETNRPVEYRTTDGRGVYRAEPIEPTEPYYDEGYGNTKCTKVRERIWEDDRLVKDQVREICESDKYERRY